MEKNIVSQQNCFILLNKKQGFPFFARSNYTLRVDTSDPGAAEKAAYLHHEDYFYKAALNTIWIKELIVNYHVIKFSVVADSFAWLLETPTITF